MNATITCGFVETSTRKLEELDTILHEMEHRQSGARLIWLERQDENKTFGIAFRTIPWDDTGVFHILEHSVLCGSQHFPVREPFVELLKGSLNTFLNAFTYPDKTCYPVSSRNDKDFLNLMRVYLDAVFTPRIYSKPEIFRQEGWHYELDEAGNPSYKGVVFNEMKGAFAAADELAMNELNRRLFPDTSYRFVSGGDPAHIPELTYEDFLAGHQKFYHPSNSYIFLDGQVNLEETLALLDAYLSGYSRSEDLPELAIQPPVDGGVSRISYELGQDEEAEGKSRVCYGYVIGTFEDRETLLAANVLADVLTGSNHAPLTRRILEEGIGENVSVSAQGETLQPIITIDVQNVKEEDLDRVGEILVDELTKLAQNGLDHSQLEASLANLEFKLRERDYGTIPRGLVFGLELLSSWLYGGLPEGNLVVGDLFDSLRAKVEEGYFESMIQRLLLENPHRCQVQLIPSHSLGDENREAEQARLTAAASGWSEETRERIAAEQKALEEWQSTPDTPEQLATIPHVTLDEVEEEPEEIPTVVEEHSGLTLVRHPVNTGGIAYVNLFFDLEGMGAEQLSSLSFLCRLMCNLETEHYSSQALQSKMRLTFGNLGFSVDCYGKVNDNNASQVKLRISASMLESKVADAIELLVEVAARTKFTNEGQILELLRQEKNSLQESIVMSGNTYAQNRVFASVNSVGVVNEQLGGISYYRWLKAQLEGEKPLGEKLAQLCKGAVSKDRLTVSVTSSSHQVGADIAQLLAEKLPESPALAPASVPLKPWGKRKEGFIIPADVAFAVQGGSLLEHQGGYSGPMQLLCKIGSLEYLWNVIRVQGGAYGTGMTLRDAGLVACSSYRDPSGNRSLGVYQESASFLRSFISGAEDLTGYIIGTVSDGSPLLSPRAMALVADMRYWKGITQEERVKNRKALLAATKEELIALCDSLEATLAQGSTCVIGSEKQLNACGNALEVIEAI